MTPEQIAERIEQEAQHMIEHGIGDMHHAATCAVNVGLPQVKMDSFHAMALIALASYAIELIDNAQGFKISTSYTAKEGH